MLCLDFEQFLQFSGQSRESLLGDMQASAGRTARVDLALRAIAAAEGLEPGDDELAVEFERIAAQVGRDVDEVKAEFVEAGSVPAVRGDLAKSSALDWLLERATLVDDDGEPVDPEDLVLPADDDLDEAAASEPDTATDQGDEEE